jgi:hypothetical protein
MAKEEAPIFFTNLCPCISVFCSNFF